MLLLPPSHLILLDECTYTVAAFAAAATLALEPGFFGLPVLAKAQQLSWDPPRLHYQIGNAEETNLMDWRTTIFLTSTACRQIVGQPRLDPEIQGSASLLQYPSILQVPVLSMIPTNILNDLISLLYFLFSLNYKPFSLFFSFFGPESYHYVFWSFLLIFRLL